MTANEVQTKRRWQTYAIRRFPSCAGSSTSTLFFIKYTTPIISKGWAKADIPGSFGWSDIILVEETKKVKEKKQQKDKNLVGP